MIGGQGCPSASFFGTVDTGCGNGESVYRLCRNALGCIGITQTEVFRGRIHWQGPCNLELLTQLNCFEKIFLCVSRAPAGQFENCVQGAPWEDNVFLWEQLSGRAHSFRVNCKRSLVQTCGSSSLQIERKLGADLQDQFGWTLDLKKPSLEVWVFAMKDETCIGLLLFHQSVRRRAYVIPTGLNPNVAWALLEYARPQPGETLLDPMC